EPGSGKTHLLQRLRLFTQKDPRTWFIYILPFPGPGRFWRHLLECFFYDICQRSKLPEAAVHPPHGSIMKEEGPGQGPLTQIEEAVTRHLMNKPLASTRELGRLWADICSQDTPGEPLYQRLGPTFDTLTIQFQLDPDVMRVLRHYHTWHHRACAYAYLLGRDLPDEDLAYLGVKQSLDDEIRAREAVLTFCRLTGPIFTIILAFDQIEGLQLTLEDLDGLRAFANNAVDLISQCRNLLILSAVQTYFLDTLKKSMHSAYYDRLAQDESVLTLLSKDSARQLIQFRLNTQKEIADLKQEDPRRGALWPFHPGDMDGLVHEGGISPRELIRKARGLFDLCAQPPVRKEKGKEKIGKEREEESRPKTLAGYWNDQFEKELQEPCIRLDAGVYEDGLLKVFQIKPGKGFQVKRGSEKDLPVILEGDGEKIGISISSSENMTSLARHLGRLGESLDGKKITKLIFLRDARLPISRSATITQERLKDLGRRGMRMIRPPAEAYAALSVLRKLWNEAAENDLMIGDSPVSMGELQRWLAEQTPRPLQDLVDDCQAAMVAMPNDLNDKLLEVLTGQWILPVGKAAEAMGLPENDLARWVMEIPEIVGCLSGPPKILFLNPEAVSRS
ncbi:MAG: hypothetical protein NTY64_02120, partial [Deltaproteobacteria bacterium]|nr:hypothetical protein [Deltaproteobacteria bacterium]